MKNLALIVEAFRMIASAYKEIKRMYNNWRSGQIKKKIKKRHEVLDQMDGLKPSKENDEKLKKLLRKLNNINEPK